jgi:hypothetical protein
MRLSESGRVTFKAILSLAFLAALIFACIKIIPAYVNNFQLKDYLQNQAPFWLAQHVSEDGIRKNVLAKTQEMNLPIAAEDITVAVSAERVSVSIDYQVPVDLKVYTLRLHFTASS